MSKNTKSSITSKNNKTCKLILEKKNNFELIKAKNVSILKETLAKESAITNL